MPGRMVGRRPSVAILIPASMGVRSAKGTCRVDISHSTTPKLHMSADRTLIS